MSLVEINGVAVLSGSISMPLVGVWTADLVIDQPDGSGFDAGTEVSIVSGDFSLSGVVAPDRTGDFLDAVHVRVFGGKGGMKKTATARSYVQPGAFVRDVVNGLMNDSGESISSTALQSFMSTNLPAWSVLSMSVSQALQTLIDVVSPGLNLRILADGTLWIGSESWPESGAAFDILSQDPTQGVFELGVESPQIVPGVSLAGIGNVGRVEHTIESGRIRSRVWLAQTLDRGVLAAIKSIVDQSMAALDYHALYIAKVKGQSADLTTVDIQPVKPNVGGLQRVAVRAGTGVKVQFATDATVLLGWDGGDPSSPYVLGGLSGESPQLIQLAGNDPLITKQDFQALIAAINGITYLPGPGAATALTFTVPLPSSYGSNKVGAGR